MSDGISIYLVRHGEATGGWDQDPDPGLSARGQEQARQAAAHLEPLGPLPIVTSPMRRTCETAAAFTALWGGKPKVEPRVSEIPSPTEDLEARRAWLTEVMAGRWGDPAAQHAGEHDLGAWRRNLIEAIAALREPTVLTSHFIAINVVVGHVLGQDQVVCFRPDNCSVTEIKIRGRALSLVSLGHEAETEVR